MNSGKNDGIIDQSGSNNGVKRQSNSEYIFKVESYKFAIEQITKLEKK